MLGLWLFSYWVTVLPLKISDSLNKRTEQADIQDCCCVVLKVTKLAKTKLNELTQTSFFLKPPKKPLFTILMRPAKGSFHATIWEQPLTLGVGPMRANRLSLVVVGMRVGRSITAGLAAESLWYWFTPAASGWSVQFNIWMRDSSGAAVYRWIRFVSL